ncbi:MAG: polysaccharide deacetylase family protein [Verrucomicrobia bacterium]|nr:polysaccharide deacetylase family protein [Verrucomicrobiota bacterium]MDA1085415.1 polysaccharide deacetylase family protein [Verrucomicrobiota bacterium]
MNLKRIIKSILLHGLACVGYMLLLPLFRRNPRAFRVLTYHSVGDRRPHETNVSTVEFERQMAFLAAAARPTRMQDLAETRDGLVPVIVTLDDGYADNLEVAAPILEKHGIPAICFLTVDFIGGDKLLPHDTSYAAQQARLLTWDEVGQLSRRGISIGSHGNAHTRLRALDDDAVRHEIAGSRDRIRAETGTDVSYLSFPYGRILDFDERAVSAAREAGYRATFSAMYGANRCGELDRPLRRIGIECSDSNFTLRAKLNGALDLLALFETQLGRSIVRSLNALAGV